MSITFGEAVKPFFKNYANFRGRATRAEYWWPLFIFIVIILLFIIALSAANIDRWQAIVFWLLIPFVFFIATLIPQWSLTVRRFHDVGLSGLSFIIPLIVRLVVDFGTLFLLCPVIQYIFDIFSDKSTSFDIEFYLTLPIILLAYFQVFLNNALNIFCVDVGVLPCGKGNNYGPNPYME